MAIIDSPVGTLALRAQDDAITGISFEPGLTPVAAPDPLLGEAVRQLKEYFAGERRGFDLPLAPPRNGTLGRILGALAEVPFGKTVSYRDLTLAAGLPIDRVRDVGQALGRNPIVIVLPCHRVIGSDGSLVGFGGGLERKRALLDLEAPQLSLA